MQSAPSLINLSLSETIGGNVETFSLTWLDSSVNDPENIEIQEKLRLHINCVKVFEKLDECQKYIEKISPNDRTIFIVSGTFGQTIVPCIHNYRQISSIYVFCMDKERNELWTKDYKKIKNVITEDDELIIEVEKDHKQQEKLRQPIAFNVLKKDKSINLPSILNSGFTHSHLLINFLLKLEPNSIDKSELYSFCRNEFRNNINELKILNRFQYDYSSEEALRWYSEEAFPYQMLNKALRTQNIHLLYLYRFFMIDVYQQLLQHQCKTPVRVYRGQHMTNDELQLFKDSVEEIISVNSFFSTSSVREKALEFINDNQPANNDLHKVLFKIDASPAVGTTKPFANISQFSEYGDEAEILFSMNTVFRINSVHNGQNGIQVIRMTLCNDDEPCLKPLVDYITNRYKNKKSNLLLFCDILCEMKKFKEAYIYNGRFLQMPEETKLLDTAKCYDNFGYLRSFANYDYHSSLTWYNKSLEIKQKFYKPNNIIFGLHYFSVGRVYEKNDDYKQASELYNKSLKIWKSIKGENHPDVITCYHKIAKMEEKMAHHSEALEYYKKVLTLRGKNLSTDDVRLGKLFFNIGNVHQHLNHYDEALDNYNLALKTYQNYITVNDLHVAFVLEKIASVYEIQKLLIQSLIYYEKTAVIYGKILPQRHPNLNRIEMHIRNIRSKLKDDGIVDQND